MKANSVGLEVQVYLNEMEIIILSDSPVKGILNFREVNSEKTRNIPFSIALNKMQKEFLEVRTTPDQIYFGDVDKIGYIINQEMYENLVERGYCGDRYWGAGRLDIHNDKPKF